MSIQILFDEIKDRLFRLNLSNWITITLAIVILLVAHSRLWIPLRRHWKRTVVYRKLPGIGRMGFMGYLIGNLDILYYAMRHLSVSKASIQFMSAFQAIDSMRTAGYVRLTIGNEQNVALFNAKAAESLVTSNTNISKSFDYDFLKSWLGTGLLTSTGDHWRRHRKILTPAFHFRILDSFVPIMNECSRDLAQFIAKNTVETPLDIRPLITNCTLDTICETAMGVRIGAQTGSQEYVAPLNRVLTLLMDRMMSPLVHNDFIYWLTSASRQYGHNLSLVQQFVRRVIQDRKAEMQQELIDSNNSIDSLDDELRLMGNKKRYAFLDSLLIEHFRNPQNFTMVDIEDEVNTFMFEGHDTTSGGLIYALMLIGSDPVVQDKIYAELESILGDDSAQSITIDHCRQMKYLELCLKESMRLYPPVPFIARKIEQDFELDNRYTVPAGCGVAVFIYALHRDPSVFPKPELFLPERFEPDQPIHRMPYAYMPFSAGPRNCIGQKFALLEMKIVVGSLLRQFRLKTITKRDQIDVGFTIVIKANSPVMIQFEKR